MFFLHYEGDKFNRQYFYGIFDVIEAIFTKTDITIYLYIYVYANVYEICIPLAITIEL